MTAKFLQVNFKFNVPAPQYREAVAPMADDFASIPGLRWKIWVINEETNESGGVYLFEDENSVNDMLNGPLVAQVLNHPALSDFDVKQFDIIEAETLITRGPISDLVAVASPNSTPPDA